MGEIRENFLIFGILAIKLRKHLDFSEVDKSYTLEKQKLQMDIKNTGKLSDIPLKLYM